MEQATKDENYPLLTLLLDEPESHDNYCGICLTIKENTCGCTQCNGVVCIDCYNNIEKCPFCRKSYDAPGPAAASF